MRAKVRTDFRKIAGDLLHTGISPGETYFVIGLNQNELRVVDNDGEPVLYPKELFDVVDPTLPAGWQFLAYPDGEYYLEPVATSSPGFYEDLFGSDGDLLAQSHAQKTLRDMLQATLNEASDEDRRLIQRDLARLKQEVVPALTP